jgi:hypothetical protein
VFTKDIYVFDEPLMPQASSLIDAIFLSRDTEIAENISITFDWLELPEADIVLKYTHQAHGGSVYKSSQVLDWTEDYEKEVWLSPVLTYFFKEPPNTLYVYINKEESD